MTDTSTPFRSSPSAFFWALAGVAVLAIGGAAAYRIATGKGPLKISADKSSGISITMADARRELQAASDRVAEAQTTVSAREQALEATSKALSEKEAKLNDLATSLAKPTAVADKPQIYADLKELRNQNPTAALDKAPKVDPRVLQQAQTHLSNVDRLSHELNTSNK